MQHVCTFCYIYFLLHFVLNCKVALPIFKMNVLIIELEQHYYDLLAETKYVLFAVALNFSRWQNKTEIVERQHHVVNTVFDI